MALTVAEQLAIVKGDGFTFPGNNSLREVINQTAIQKSIEFLDGYKTFATTDGGDPPQTINAGAAGYVAKMLRVSQALYRNEVRVINKLTEMMIAVLGKSNITAAQADGATEAQWLVFLADNMIEVLEFASGVTKEEKAEYEALP
jgi:hypothetical protein